MNARSETGAVAAIVAVILAGLLALAALVITSGEWFTHKRQLQTRADSAAFAAAVEYAARWSACVGSDTTAKTNARNAIVQQARKYAGDPTGELLTGYNPATTPPVNTEIADQTKLNVVLNSTNYDAGSDYTDGPVGDVADPCYEHTSGDDISAPGYWADVKVKERDFGSVFGLFGLPLARNTARARVEIRPQISANKFIPLAVPEQLIVKAQVRYINKCSTSANYGAVLAKSDLWPLEDGQGVGEQNYQPLGATTLWGPKPSGQNDPNPGTDVPPPETDPSGISLTVPAEADCGTDYLPVGVEVRVSGRKSIDIDTPTCAQLQAKKFADCWGDGQDYLSTIRTWRTANSPEFRNVTITGGNCAQDAYFSRTASCNGNVGVDVNFGSRPGYLVVEAEGSSLQAPGGGTVAAPGTGSGVWTSSGTIGVGAANGQNTIQVRASYGCNSQGNSCSGTTGDVTVHRTFVADDANAGTVDVIRTSGSALPADSPLPAPLDNIQRAPAAGSQLIFPAIGLRSSLRPGQYRTLRFDNSQGNQSVDCEPTGGQGHDFQMFYLGCQPYYGPNDFTELEWWDPVNDRCPQQNWGDYPPNSKIDPWECVRKAPGFSPPVISGGIAARIGNCTSINNNACNSVDCIVPNNYDAWVAGTEPANATRVVKLFIVPYGAFKNTGPQDGLPILGFAAFYVTGWDGNGQRHNDCEDGSPTGVLDDPAEIGEVVGHFVVWVDNDPGPVDPTKVCVVNTLTPCRAVLVR